MSIINTLDGLRYDPLGPILEPRNSDVEIKNIYRILQVIAPLLGSLGLKSNFLDAGGTARNWDTVEFTRQIHVAHIQSGVQAWKNGSTGYTLSPVADATPPTVRATYGLRIPASKKSGGTVTLKWRFYNQDLQSGDTNVEWRIQYNSPPSTGTLTGLNTASVITALATDQALFTIIEESVTLDNVVEDDLLNVTMSIDDGATTTLGNMVVLDGPWIEFTQVGLPDVGSTS